MMMVEYSKEFESLKEGFTELCTIIPDVMNYIGEHCEFEDGDERDFLDRMIDAYMKNPSISNNYSFPFTNKLTATPYGVFLENEHSFRFGWKCITEDGDLKGYRLIVAFKSLKTKRTGETYLDDHEWNRREFERSRRKSSKPSDND